MTEPILLAQAIGVARGGATILSDVSLAAATGEVVALMGPSGSGKSTLLAVLAGLSRPDTGFVTYRGAPVSAVPESFGVVLQGYGLVNLLTAAENVEIALQARGMPRREVRALAQAALAEVGLAEVAEHLVEELSGGQQQRVAIARALVTGPQVLIADEITSELDTVTKAQIVDVVLGQTRAGATVILATHDPDLAARCDRVIQLDGGRLHDDRRRAV